MDLRGNLDLAIPQGYIPWLTSDAPLLSLDAWEHLSAGAYNIVPLVGNALFGGIDAAGEAAKAIDESPKVFGLQMTLEEHMKALGPFGVIEAPVVIPAKALECLGLLGRILRGVCRVGAVIQEESLLTASGTTLNNTTGLVNVRLKNDVPWYRYLKPEYSIEVKVQTEGRTAFEIAMDKAHEGRHIRDILEHPDIVHLASQDFFPGAGLARYWLEYRGYQAGGQLDNLLTPLRSFETLKQKESLAEDLLILGGGTVGGAAGLIYIYGPTSDGPR